MRVLRVITAIVLLIIASVSMTLLVSQFSGGYIASASLRRITEIVTGSFGSLSLCIPFYLFWFFYICWNKNSTLLSLLWPTASTIPFFTLTLGIKTLLYDGKTLAPPLWDYMEWMGRSSVTTLWFFATALSVFIITILYSYGFKSLRIRQKQEGNTQQNGSVLKNIYHSFFEERDDVSAFRSSPHLHTHTEQPDPQYSDYRQEQLPTLNKEYESRVPSHPRYPGENTSLEHVVLVFNRNAKPPQYSSQRIKDLQEEAEQDAIIDEFPLGADAFSYPSKDWNAQQEVAQNEDSNEYPEKYPERYPEKYPERYPDTADNTTLSKKNDDEFLEAYETQHSDSWKEEGHEFVSASLGDDTMLSNTHDIAFAETTLDTATATDTAIDTAIDTGTTQNKNIREKKNSSSKNSRHIDTHSYSIPVDGILDSAPTTSKASIPINDTSRLLEETLAEFNIEAEVTGVKVGPVVTRFEILPSPGVRLRRIVELSDNIALRLAAPSIRIVAPIPGKQAVGVEVPNHKREIVPFSQIVAHPFFGGQEKQSPVLPLALGKDISDNIVIEDLATSPHLLIAGATGSGKSVCVNAFICSLLYSLSPDRLKLLLIDPKIVELSFYNDIAHLLTPVITEPEYALTALKWCADEMERRYRMLENHGAREITSFNLKMKEKKQDLLPYMVIVIDEFADLMVSCGKELEILVSRIAAKSRAVGIHLIVATQRPSTDVITGLIKANIPSRIAFMVTSKTDSRIILDMNGAEKLLGKGDMLYSSSYDPYPLRIQGTFLSEHEVDNVVSHIKRIAGPPNYIDEEIFAEKETGDMAGDLFNSQDDPLWNEAIEEIKFSKKASASYLQRRFKIGYNRAARIVDEMEQQGIIGPSQGSKAREVLV